MDTAPQATPVWGAVSNAETPIDRTSLVGQVILRTRAGDYDRWLDHVRPAAGCTRPIRLTGTIDTHDKATGARLARVDTATLPDGVLYKACGNRRHTVCPSCAETYRRDAFQLIRAGLVGGKGVPESVATHDAVFPTFTAPSFGTVHTRVVRKHTCTGRRRCDCRAEPCHVRRDSPGRCEHGQPTVCFARHEENDPRLGKPLCLDCYDHDHQVVWNYHAGELWRRTKQAIERHLARLATKRGISPVIVRTATGNLREVPPVRVSHGKVAEFQARGAVHFHALVRLDGVDPDDPDAIVPAPDGITADDLDDAIHTAAAQAAFTTPPHPDNLEGWRIAWGDQFLVKHITMRGEGEVTDLMAAAYLAKYATKSTEATGHRSARLTPDTIDDHADADGDHTARLLDACWRLGRPTHTPQPLADRPRPARSATALRSQWTCPTCGNTTRLAVCPHCPASAPVDTYVSKPEMDNPYAGLRRWAHMLGFGGHFLTKARRYSTTFGLLREARTAYRRTEHLHGPDDWAHADDHTAEDTTLVVGTLTFAGVGWHTFGDALLANTVAALARARHATGREEIDHEIGTALAVGVLPVAA
nr:replication initiator [Planosporangium mesophilum]